MTAKKVAGICLSFIVVGILSAGILTTPRTGQEPGPVNQVVFPNKVTNWYYPTVATEKGTWGGWLMAKLRTEQPATVVDIGALVQMNLAKASAWWAAWWYVYGEEPPVAGWEVVLGNENESSLSYGSVVVAVDGSPLSASGLLASSQLSTSKKVTYRDMQGMLHDVDGPIVVAAADILPWRGPPLDMWPETPGIGGGSAGLALSLAYVEYLTGNSLALSPVAATGIIDTKGEISKVGGVVQKSEALKNLVDFFIVPNGNIDDITVAGLDIIHAQTLAQAVLWLCQNSAAEC